MDFPVEGVSQSLVPELYADKCVLVFSDDFHSPIPVAFKCGATIAELLDAHFKLVGSLPVSHITDHFGNTVSSSKVLEVGQFVQVHVQGGVLVDDPSRECGPLPGMPVDRPVDAEQVGAATCACDSP